MFSFAFVLLVVVTLLFAPFLTPILFYLIPVTAPAEAPDAMVMSVAASYSKDMPPTD